MSKTTRTYNIYIYLLIISILYICLLSTTTSPLYDHYPFWFHGDSGIFQEMGVCLVQGGTPYVDLFDHKGPILWFIQALGIWLSPRWGLVLLQSISLFMTILLWYKTIAIFIRKVFVKYLFVGLCLFFLLCFYSRGNLCEEWSLPFISWPIYLYLKRNKEGILFEIWDCFFVGCCVGALSLIRMNNIAPIVGLVLWFYVLLIKDGAWQRFFISVLLMSVGVIIVFIPCGVFYYVKGAWHGVEEMFYGTFGYNFQYIAEREQWSLLQLVQYYIPPIGFIIITALCVRRQNVNLTIPLLISYLVTITTIGNRLFYHYLMVFIPLFVVSMCLIYSSCSKFVFTLFGIILMQCFLDGYSAIDCLVNRLKGNPPNTELHDGFHRFVSSLPEKERQSIYNAGLNHMGAGLFADENIYQCNRFVSNSHILSSKRLSDYEQSHGLDIIKPVWVLTQAPSPTTDNTYFQHNYRLADSIPGGEFDTIWCWKKLSK